MAYSVPNPVASREKILGFIKEGLSQKEASDKYGIDKGYLSYQCKYFGLKMKKKIRSKESYFLKKPIVAKKPTAKTRLIAKGSWVTTQGVNAPIT